METKLLGWRQKMLGRRKNVWKRKNVRNTNVGMETKNIGKTKMPTILKMGDHSILN